MTVIEARFLARMGVYPVEVCRGGRSGGKRSRKQDAAVDVCDIRAAAEGHREIELVADDLERLGYARLAHRAQTVQERAADIRATRAERPGFEDVLARADAAVQMDLDLR